MNIPIQMAAAKILSYFMSKPIITSILDSDQYKFTMAQAVGIMFPHAHTKYKFINRGRHKFTRQQVNQIQIEIDNMRELQLINEEYWWLKKTCPYLNPVYLDFLSSYRFNPSEVKVTYRPTEREDYLQDFIGNLEIEITGPWYRAIYWEVPIMAIISEVYNRNSKQPTEDDVYNAHDKICILSNHNCKIADLGTRRRLNQQHHDNIIERASEVPGFVGTSNVHLAHKWDTKPIGTQAHEWFMFHGAKYGYREANKLALKNWVKVYHGNLGIALTDTFGTDNFFKVFGSKYSKLFDGVRHDSGNPFEFALKTIHHYERLGIDPQSKTIIFSDGLNPEKAIELKEYCDTSIKCSFGIGTNLTNDIENGAKPLNIVIKMSHCKPYGEEDWLPVVKLSDDEGKNTGDPKEVNLCKQLLRI